ncbi:MAG: LuxR C-terminal-related transcriptional regulator [Chloroflexaceae bacterium]
MPHAQAEVRERTLILARPGSAGAHIPLDTPAWYAWLTNEQVRSFRYCHPLGILTVRKERRARGGWYWSAYRRVDGHLRKQYLGRSSELTAARLEAAVLTLQRVNNGHQRPGHAPGNDPTRTLIATKFMVPLPDVALVIRPRLLSRLAGQRGGRVTTVVAPAGSGKTTLLASWLLNTASRTQNAERPGQDDPTLRSTLYALRSGWLSLDPADNDPLRFWRYVLAALEPALPALASEQIALSHAASDAVGDVAVNAIIQAISARPERQFILVLDDYHVIACEQIHRGIARLLRLLPFQLHLVISSRTEPPLPLPRLRVRGLLLELRAADLAFTVDEATALLREIAPESPALDVAELTGRTEGWAAGLRLALLSLHGERRWSRQAPERLFAYLMDEVFHQQPASIQRFLLLTALPERLCAPLCAQLLYDAAAAADMGSALAVAHELLTTLERQGLFLTALDPERRWFRYHHLFREFLRHAVEASEPELVPRLQRSAGRWFAGQDLIGEALPLLLAGSDVETAADLVESRVEIALWEWYDQAAVRDWLHLLPSEVIRARWRLACADLLVRRAASPSQLAAEFEPRIAALLADLPPGPLIEAWQREDPPPPPGTPADGEIRRRLGLVAFAQLLLDRLARGSGWNTGWLRRAEQWLRPEDGILYLLLLDALRARALAHHDFAAVERYAGAMSRLPGGRYLVLRTAVTLVGASVYYRRGQMNAAHQQFTRCRHLLQQHQLQHGILGARAFALMGRLAYERNELGQALADLEASRRARWQWWEPETHLPAALYLALTIAASGQEQSLAGPLDQVECWQGNVPAEHDRGVRAVLELCRLRLALVRAGADTRAIAREWLAGQSPDRLRQSYAATLPVLQELADLALARALIHAGRAAEARLMLAQVSEEAQAQGRLRAFWETRVLLALAMLADGDEATAVTTLAAVLPAIVHAQLPRLLLDEGAPAAALLAQIIEGEWLPQVARDRAIAWLAAFPAEQRPDRPPCAAVGPAPDGGAPLEPLSQRERQILQLLADGADTRTIAATLFIADSTVKWHIRNLCGKLQVRTRLQALARARHQGLIQ